MFDFAWSEIALIGVVALIAIGPKDMPVALKTVSTMLKKARRMASEFQTHVDDMMRDADLHELRDGVRQFRNFDLRGTIEKAVDPDGTIKSTLSEDPFQTVAEMPNWQAPEPARPGVAPPPAEAPAVEPDQAEAFLPPWARAERAAREAAPAFIPPSTPQPGAAPPTGAD
jgi:sec-independent protein translocase protein TatB